MTETQKPFACPIKGCDMTFTNEDHLNWHQKKHDMMLNLGLASKHNEVADQTPTPTRFIRNCEEVGLFQDLQNVNPFDEFFKKAVEVGKSGGTLEVSQNQTNSDDTLHTPHILPHIEETQKKISATRPSDNSHSDDFLHNVISLSNGNNDISNIVETHIFVENDNNQSKVLETRLPNIKLKIKEALQTKDTHKNQNINASEGVFAMGTLLGLKEEILDKKTENNSNNNNRRDTSRGRWKNISPGFLKKVREMNRASQLRCRKRKKEALQNMEEELQSLRYEVKRLRTENAWLKGQILGDSKNTNDTASDKTLKDSPHVSPESIGAIEQSKSSPKTTKQPIPSVRKISIRPNNVTTITSPLIQLVQVVPAVTIPITTNQIIDVQKYSKPIENIPVKKKNVRKIVPQIEFITID